jgi:hypothetical protein
MIIFSACSPKHLFCVSPRTYCEKLDPDYVASTDEVFDCLVHPDYLSL